MRSPESLSPPWAAPTKTNLPFSLGELKSHLQLLALSSQGTVNYIGPTQSFGYCAQSAVFTLVLIKGIWYL